MEIISSTISFDSHLVNIRWFMEVLDYCIVLVLYLDHVSSCDISPLLLWGGSPLCVRYMVQHINIFFTNAYVRSLLELSINFLHGCVNILTIYLYPQYSAIPTFDQARFVRGHSEYGNINSWSQCHLAQEAYCRHFWLDVYKIVLEFYSNILQLLYISGWSVEIVLCPHILQV